MKRALITGITGQDGGYLAKLLHEKGYEVHGLRRRTSQSHPVLFGTPVQIHVGDVTDLPSLQRVVRLVQPHEVYNLAAMSHVGDSYKTPFSTADITGTGAIRLMHVCQQELGDACRFYQASSSEMFGNADESPQSETTPFRPISPYAVAKVAAHYAAGMYRETYGMHISCGILFNHESPHRGVEFVTRKVTKAVARIKLGLQDKLALGNLESYRDWGYAGDYVEAMWLMLQQDEPDDYVIATGETHSIRDLLDAAFVGMGLEPWGNYVETDPGSIRPNDVALLLGDSTKAREKFGWEPTFKFKDLIWLMVRDDLAREEKA